MRKRHSPEQIAAALRQAEAGPAATMKREFWNRIISSALWTAALRGFARGNSVLAVQNRLPKSNPDCLPVPGSINILTLFYRWNRLLAAASENTCTRKNCF
ncbi:MAG TPA: hypothetical protein VMS32_00605 [Verrucomicrobiae bacterium]|jgi:hypothetical protein|nr:hypothetical protein [Verrucomicrobiae bacterium]